MNIFFLKSLFQQVIVLFESIFLFLAIVTPTLYATYSTKNEMVGVIGNNAQLSLFLISVLSIVLFYSFTIISEKAHNNF